MFLADYGCGCVWAVPDTVSPKFGPFLGGGGGKTKFCVDKNFCGHPDFSEGSMSSLQPLTRTQYAA